MASPQKENGHTAIANEILDTLCKTRINGQDRQVLDFIFRKTYGWQKKRDRISLSQFEDGTGMKRARICDCLKNLINMKIIIKIQDDNGSTYEFNKNYDEWELVPKQARASDVVAPTPRGANDTRIVPQVGRPIGEYRVVPQVGTGVVPQVGHTKETIQKKIQKACVSSLKSLPGITTGDSYQADGFSPKDRITMKRRLEKSLGLKKTNVWSDLLFGSAWDFLTAFEKYQGYKYPDNVLLDEVSKTLAKWYELGETRETIREMLIAFFEGKKSEKVTVTPNSVFSSHTYNSWKQNKL